MVVYRCDKHGRPLIGLGLTANDVRRLQRTGVRVGGQVLGIDVDVSIQYFSEIYATTSASPDEIRVIADCDLEDPKSEAPVLAFVLTKDNVNFLKNEDEPFTVTGDEYSIEADFFLFYADTDKAGIRKLESRKFLKLPKAEILSIGRALEWR